MLVSGPVNQPVLGPPSPKWHLASSTVLQLAAVMSLLSR